MTSSSPSRAARKSRSPGVISRRRRRGVSRMTFISLTIRLSLVSLLTPPRRYTLLVNTSPASLRGRPMTPATTDQHAVNLDQTIRFLRDVRKRIGEVVVGQDVVVERVLIALFTGGHLLLQGVPGLAKTLLVAVLAKSIDLQFARIQFTIDLLPSDILGSEILDARTQEFRTVQGPIFTNLLLADEINRAAPRVQSALLEAMQERKVTIAKTTFK